MDIFLVIGVIIGLAAVIVGMIVKGANVLVLLNPAAAIIILVGTFAAVMNSYPKKEFLNIPKIIKVLFSNRKVERPADIIGTIVELAQFVRKEGLLSLEQHTQSMDNKFLKNGLTLVIDGLDLEYIKEVLEIEIESMEERHRAGAAVLTSAGGAAPTLGVLGAVIGLIGALGNLNDTAKLGHMIAAAFVATLYGIFFGYVLFHPFATRLKRKSHEEVHSMRITMEGILSIQAGENPKNIELKLLTMLSPSEKMDYEKKLAESQSKGEVQ